METVDLTKVAGFKALDSDGNELGIVSMEQLTESIAMRIADGLSERTVLPANNVPMAVAATSTGSDKMETAFSETTDPAYVRVIDKNGNSAKQGISSLATVVGELIGTATSDKDGLMSRHYAIRRIVAEGGSGRYFMFKLSGYRAYGTFEFIANTDDGRMLLCTVTFSGFTGSPIKPALIKNKEFYGHLKFYRKEGDNRTFYFQLFTGSNATSLFIRCLTANNYVADVESSDEPAESLIEIPMS